MKKREIHCEAKAGLVLLIELYKNTFSILFGPCCRFTPSCSSYASLSIQRFGIMKGASLTFKRIIKCNPFHPGGWDPVPEIPAIHPFPACPEQTRLEACRRTGMKVNP